MAQIAEVAMEQMAAALAHEVKNPLSLVRASVELLATRDEAPGHVRHYETIKTELEKIDALLMQFLTLTKSETGRDLVYVADLLAVAVDRYEGAYPQIIFSLAIDDCELATVGSFDNLQMVINNVIKNAVEAMKDQETGQVWIALKEIKEQLIIEVKDTGIGLSETVKQGLGGDFFTTKVGGTGLGLGICKKIMADHGGDFTIDNWEQGTVVTLRLNKG